MKGENGMRDKFRVYENEEVTILATYKKYAITNHRRNNLFINVTDTEGNELADHMWIKLSTSKAKKLDPKHTYILVGTISTYYKKDKDGNKVADYCITNITEVREVI